jgi:hypothetical protein
MSEGIFLRMFWDLQNSEMSREFPAILGLSWFGLFCTCWLRFPRWDYLGSLPWGLSGIDLDSLGSPEKDYKKIRKDFYIQKRFLILTLYKGYKRFLKCDSYF